MASMNGTLTRDMVTIADAPAKSLTLTEQQLTALLAARDGKQAGTTIGADSDIQYHSGTSVLVPEGMTMEFLRDMADEKAKELNKVHQFQHITRYRPDDGANAAAVVIKRMFGMTIGKDTKTMFGSTPPTYRTIWVSHNRKIDVPWGKLAVVALPGAVFNFLDTGDDSGPVFAIIVESPKKHQQKIEEFFAALDDELRLNSIYRGRSLLGAHELKFLDVSSFNRDQIVFSERVTQQLDAHVFARIRHADACRAANISTKAAVILEGPYGTGKSSAGLITAQVANDHGWTYLSARAGRDNLPQVFRTADRYQPCVLFIEDIDRYTPKAKDKDALSELLDMFDGIGSKNSKLLIVLTTNDIGSVPAGMLRPGRLDAVISIAGLDRASSEQLIRAVIPADMLDSNVDYDAVWKEMTDFQPAWTRAVATNAIANAIARSGGSLVFQLTTEDLVRGARDLHPQLDLMRKASEGAPVNMLDETLAEVVSAAARKGLHNTPIIDEDGDLYGRIMSLKA